MGVANWVGEGAGGGEGVMGEVGVMGVMGEGGWRLALEGKVVGGLKEREIEAVAVAVRLVFDRQRPLVHLRHGREF